MRRRPKVPDPRAFAQFYAAARRASGVQLAKYVLCPFGLASDLEFEDIVVDDTIVLVQGHTDGNVYLCPLRGKPQRCVPFCVPPFTPTRAKKGLEPFRTKRKPADIAGLSG